MTRRQLGSTLAGLAAAGFIGTAALHATGYGPVTEMARRAPPELTALTPALWLSFSFDLCVLGLIVIVVALLQMRGGWLVLALAAINPLVAAGLQVKFLGFIGPTAILIALGCLTLAAAAALGPVGGGPRPGPSARDGGSR